MPQTELTAIISRVTAKYGHEMENDILIEKALKLSAEIRSDRATLNKVIQHMEELHDEIVQDLTLIRRFVPATNDPSKAYRGMQLISVLEHVEVYVTAYRNACIASAEADPYADFDQLFAECDAARVAYEQCYDSYLQAADKR